jgi:FkbM family methyltransferase
VRGNAFVFQTKKGVNQNMLGFIKRIARKLLRPPLHKAEISLPFRVLGTDYGGWPLLTSQTRVGTSIFSFGVGEDISFDLAAIDQFGANINAFDPTPKSLRWINEQKLPETFCFHMVGLAAEDGEVEFFAPEKDQNVSYSAQPAPNSDLAQKVSAPVKRLETLVAELGVTSPDILKMDIEGFEYAVIDDILAGAIRPQQWLIEFHHQMYKISNERTEEAVAKLRDGGYLLYYVSESGHEYGFVHNSVIAPTQG